MIAVVQYVHTYGYTILKINKNEKIIFCIIFTIQFSTYAKKIATKYVVNARVFFNLSEQLSLRKSIGLEDWTDVRLTTKKEVH